MREIGSRAAGLFVSPAHPKVGDVAESRLHPSNRSDTTEWNAMMASNDDASFIMDGVVPTDVVFDTSARR